jgi:hypothetical protein
VAVTDPVTTPVEEFGVPTVVLVVGTVFLGAIITVTADVAVPPLPSVTVTVTVSVVTDVAAPDLAAA